MKPINVLDIVAGRQPATELRKAEGGGHKYLSRKPKPGGGYTYVYTAAPNGHGHGHVGSVAGAPHGDFNYKQGDPMMHTGTTKVTPVTFHREEDNGDTVVVHDDSGKELKTSYQRLRTPRPGESHHAIGEGGGDPKKAMVALHKENERRIGQTDQHFLRGSRPDASPEERKHAATWHEAFTLHQTADERPDNHDLKARVATRVKKLLDSLPAKKSEVDSLDLLKSAPPAQGVLRVGEIVYVVRPHVDPSTRDLRKGMLRPGKPVEERDVPMGLGAEPQPTRTRDGVLTHPNGVNRRS